MDETLNLPLITLNPSEQTLDTQPVPEQISLVPEGDPSANVPPSPALAQERTFKVNYGANNVMKRSAEQIYQDIATGHEDTVRQEAAGKLDQQANAIKQGELIKYAARKQGPLTTAEVDYITRPFERTDPDLVIESSYAKKYVGSLQDAAAIATSSWYNQAMLDVPEHVEAAKAKAEDITTRMEFFRTQLQNAQEAYQQQGYFSWGVDLLKGMTQIYPELKMRPSPGQGFFSNGLLLGSNLQAQADHLYEIPLAQAKEEFLLTFNKLKKDNPSLAVQYAEYAVGKANDDRLLDNAFTLLAPFDIAAAAKGSLNVIRYGNLFNQTNKAFKEAVKGAEAMGTPTVSKIAEVGGDLKTAAETKVIETATAGRTVSPMDTLTTNLRMDSEKIFENYEGLSREQATRLYDQDVAARVKLENTLDTSARVRRAVTPLQDPEYVAKLNEAARETYRGVDNQILDISNPEYDELRLAFRHRVSFGNADGNLFSEIDVAKNNAELNGFKNVHVEEAIGSVEKEPARLMGNKTDLRRKAQLEDSIPAAQRALKDTEAKIRVASKETKGAKTIWRNKDGDFPIEIVKEEPQVGPDGRKYQKVKYEGKESYVPSDEIVDGKAKLTSLKADRDFFKATIKKYQGDLKDITSRLTPIDPVVEQHGIGYKFVINHYVDETSDLFRDMLIGTKDRPDPNALSTSSAKGITAWRQAAIGWITGADNTLAKYETMQRKTATYGINRFREWADEQGKYIKQVSTGIIRNDPVTGAKLAWARPKAWLGQISNKEISEQFNRVLNYAKTEAKDPITGEPGWFEQTPGALNDLYIRFFNRPASMAEHEAYRAYVRTYEAERIFAEMAEYRNRARLGAAQHQINVMNGREKLSSTWFDGMQEKSFPGGKDQILVMGDRLGDEKIYNLNSMDKPTRDNLKKLTQNGGGKVIRIYNPDAHPLSEFSNVAGNERIRYVFTKDASTKELEFNHVNRRGGGHFEHDVDNYVKVARVVPQQGGAAGSDKRRTFQHDYVGDVTVMGVQNRVMGRAMTEKMEAVRKLIHDDKWVDAEALARRTLPMEWDEFSKWYKPSRGPGGKIIPPALDTDQEFRLVPKNRLIADLDKTLEDKYPGTWNNAVKSGSDAAQFRVGWNQERDSGRLMNITDTGTKGNALYHYQPADFVDPIPTLNRSLNRAINSVFMDDYKLHAVEAWMRENAAHLKASESDLRSSPMWHFENAPFDFKPGVDKATQWIVRSNRMKVKQFIGIPDKFDTWIDGLTQELSDRAYTKYGPEGSRSVVDNVKIIPLRMLSKVTDPVDYLRSMAFNFKLGLFSIPQFLVQAQSHALIWAIEPRHGTVGTYATLLHTWARFTENPEILKHLDEYATKLNMFGSKWKPGEFLEARKNFNESGFEKVGHEHAYDDVSKPEFVKGEFGSFLKAGRVFFDEGERASRTTAYYTSFRKFMDENPGKILNDIDKAEILNYADLLNNNMSRASASVLHGGVFSMTSQFLSYQLRMGELFWGKRLGETIGERTAARLRILGMYSALYGAGPGLSASGIPMVDAIRREAIDRGYVINDNYLTTMAMEGIPSWIMTMATGQTYNVGNRLGPSGFTQVRDIFRQDSTMLSILGGASLGIFANTVASGDPFLRHILGIIRSDDKSIYPLTGSDFSDLFKEISSYNQAWKVYAALNYGIWFNKQEATVTKDISAPSAIFMGMTGLSPQKQDDAFQKGQISKGEDNYQKYLMKVYAEDGRRWALAVKDKDYDLATKMGTRMKAILEIGGFPISRRAEATAAMNKSMEDIIGRGDYSFGLNNVPTRKWFQSDVPQTRLEQYRKELRNNQ